MLTVFLIALFVGGATMLGGVLGYFMKKTAPVADGAVFSFAAGVMLAASFAELILPVTENTQPSALLLGLTGIVAGGALLHLLQKPLDRITESRLCRHSAFKGTDRQKMTEALLFVAAITIHNLPEGLAAGIGAGADDFRKTLTVAAGVALQNVPEGMIVLTPLVAAGFSRKRALAVSLLTGVIEIAGTFLGYFAASAAGNVLPFFLCLAGGCMLFIICTDVIEFANRLAGKTVSGYAFLFGCCGMLLMDRFFS